MKFRFACAAAALLLIVPFTLAQTTTASALPRLVRFGGAVKDLNGNPLTGVVGITFALYSEQTGGAALWLETQNVTADANGHYVALLGSTKPDGLPTDLFTSEQARWVGVQVSGQAEQPRVLLVSAPYALKAGDAETIGGLPPSAFVKAPPETGPSAGASASQNGFATSSSAVGGATVGGTGVKPEVVKSEAVKTAYPYGTANYVPLWTSTNLIANSKIYQSTSGATSGDVGIGTTTPAATLDVNGTINAATSFNLGSNLFAFGSFANNNAFLGFAGNTTMTGIGNSAVGYQALYSNTTGNYNTAAGIGALSQNTTGIVNTASGYHALFSNTTGSDNTAAGIGALENNTMGSNNTAAGDCALCNNTTGSENTAIGIYAGQTFDNSNMTGNDNTAVGFAAEFGTGSLTNATAIGAFALVTESNALVLGSVGHGGVPNPSVGIGKTAPAATLDVLDNGTGGSTISSNTARAVNAVYGGNSATSGSGANGGYFVTASPRGAGVVGVNSASGGTAGYFSGNVYISGSLTKSSGTFLIDHPLDPAHKYLYHSFVESPDMMNVYNGNVVTNQRGVATVTLPDYFEALNQDFRYQLTVIGQFAQAIVAKEINGNRFTIKTSKPGVKVSWQVTGIRHDAYADAHRVEVQVEKPPQEQGRYLHPELFGAPAEQAIGYVAPPVPTERPQQAEGDKVSSLKRTPVSLK